MTPPWGTSAACNLIMRCLSSHACLGRTVMAAAVPPLLLPQHLNVLYTGFKFCVNMQELQKLHRSMRTFTEGLCVTKSLPVAQVVGARGLRAADSNGLSDPYVVVRLGDAAEQTRVVPECLDPDWNETFVFSAAQVRGRAFEHPRRKRIS